MILRLSVRVKGSDVLSLGYRPGGRLLFGAIAVFMGSGMIALGEFSLAMTILAAIGAAVALYDDAWSFDRPSGQFRRRRGFAFLARTRAWPLSDINGVILRVVSGPNAPEDSGPFSRDPVVPELLRKGRSVLLLDLGGPAPRRIVLEDGSHRDREALEALGLAISSFCGVPLQK